MQAIHEELQARTAELVEGELVPGVRARSVTEERWMAEVLPVIERTLPTSGSIDPRALFSDGERTRFGSLDQSIGAAPFIHRIAFEREGRVVGGFFGVQEQWARYQMMITAIDPAERGRGIYSAFLQRIVAWAEAAGFREIYSRHVADNNAVLVPKLKAGFVIGAMEVAHNFGLLVHLKRPLGERNRALHAWRVGSDPSNGRGLIEAGVLPDRRRIP